MSYSLTFLGTGASLGVPVIGCKCAVCHSSFSRNKRGRAASLLYWKGKQFLIDPGPDVREQLIRNQVYHIDGVILTHGHYDHIGGFDDLRIFPHKNQKPMPCLASSDTKKEIERRCHYLFANPMSHSFTFQLIDEDFDKEVFQGLPLTYLTYHQQGMKVNGFIFGNLAYITDIKDYSDEIFKMLQGVDILVISTAYKEKKSPLFIPAHLTLAEAITFAGRVKAKQTILTHLNHDMDYERVTEELPPNMALAYDSMVIDIIGS